MKRALLDLTAKASLRRPATVVPEALNVAPHLVGAALATPLQRTLAMAVDLIVIGILSSGGDWLLLPGLALVLFQLRSDHRSTKRERQLLVWGLCAVLLWQGLQFGASQVPDDQESTPAVVQGRPAALPASTASDATRLPTTPPPQTSEPGDPPAALATLAQAAAMESLANELATAHERISELERELEAARKPQVFRWRTEAQKWLDALGVGFGWAIVYFSLLPAWLDGQTLGKKLLKLRVVELTGKPLTVMVCFGRYGGYVAGMATGMVGFIRMLWDDNRQAVQDKVAHTVVLDVRAPPNAPTPDS